MKLTCLVTAQPAEGESVEIEFSCDAGWHQKLHTVLTLLDNRLSEMASRVIADTTACASLTPEQYNMLLQIVSCQFPFQDIDITQMRFADVRVLVRKMTNNREQIALRFDCSETDDIHDALIQAFTVVDDRMIATNTRDLEAYAMLNNCTPQDKQPIQMILDCLYGRADAHQVGVRLASHALVEAKKEVEAALQNGEEV